MTTFAAFLATPVVERLGWVLVHFVWLGAAVAVLFAAVQALLRNRSAESRYAAACAALVIMAILPVATFVFVPASQSARPSKEPAVAEAVLENSAAQAPTPEPTETASQPAGISRENRFGVPPSVGNKPTKVGTPSASSVFGERTAPTASMLREETGGSSKPGPTPYAARIRDAFARLEPLLPRLVFIWLVGVVLLSLRLLGGWVQVGRLKRRWAAPAAERWQQMLLDVARRLRLARPVRLLESAAARVPTVIGWLRPVILLPASILTGLAPEQIEALLAHELAHIRRYDYLVNLVQTVIETLLFYHPAVWWISRRIRIEREHCCDDLAVATCGDALVYARALANLESLRAAAPQPVLAATAGPLLSRIRRILAPPAQRPGCSPRWLAGAIVLGAIIMVATIIQLCALAAPRSETAPSGRQRAAAAPSAIRPDDAKTTGTTAQQPSRVVERGPYRHTPVEPTTRTLEIRVVNAQTSEPLPGVKISIAMSRWWFKKRVNAETDAKGCYVFDWYSSVPLESSLEAFKEGFVPLHASVVAPYLGGEDGLYGDPPTKVIIAIEPGGAAIGGMVLNNEGKPLENVSVIMSIPAMGRISSGRLYPLDNVTITTTGADGRWRTNCLPPYYTDSMNLPVIFDHYDYGRQSADAGVKRLPTRMNLTEMKHILIMKPGKVLRGRVLDRDGRPIANALVGIGESRLSRRDVEHTDGQGRFRWDNGRGDFHLQWYLAASAPGYAPELEVTTFTLRSGAPSPQPGQELSFSYMTPEQIGPLPPPVEFRLGRGHTIRGRVVDKDGKPLYRVEVDLSKWKNCTLVFWRPYTDADGRFAWTGAPPDPVTFRFEGEQVMTLPNVELTPGDREHVITMTPALHVTGNVVDAQTSRPLSSFRALLGDRRSYAGEEWVTWQRETQLPWQRRVVLTAEGHYETTFTYPFEAGHLVRIEADGYVPAESRPIRSDEGNVTIHFALRPHAGIRGVVRAPDGTPLAGAMVVLATPSHRLAINNGRFGERYEGRPRGMPREEYTTKTLANGRFWFRPITEPFTLVVLHDRGFARPTEQQLAASSNVVLTPWGRIEGRRLVGSEPLRQLDMNLMWPEKEEKEYVTFVNQNVAYNILRHSPTTRAGPGSTEWQAVPVMVDDQGHFIFDRVVPGSGWFARPASQAYIPVEVKAGETTRLQIGGMGRAVVGRIIVPAGRESEFSFGTASSDMYLIKPYVPVPEETRKQGADAIRAWEQNWLRSDEGKKYIQATAGYTITLKPDGSFTITDVVEGTYHLRVTTKGGAVEHDFTMPDIPGGRSDEPLDLGRLELKTSGWEPGGK